MQLQPYQKKVLSELSRFLYWQEETHSPSQAYSAFWAEQGFSIELGMKEPYQDTLAGVPHVCAKIPTGGGKTYLAASAVKTIFDAMPSDGPRAVVWLVPSDPILVQTWNALNDVRHPYRERLDVDFCGAVQVYSKAAALSGQNFKPGDVKYNLSVFVLSYDSFRTSKKEGRKAYQQNGYLQEFAKYVKKNTSILLPDTDETALIQVIRSLKPVVIVDESHHAASPLSVEMLQNFNPRFVFDLTATPRKNSNIISYVDAIQLKGANMVKLPVIVYNRKSQSDVYGDAMNIREKLEVQAREDEKKTGRYIRPIVLFQAQPKGTPDNTTYEKIRKTLIDAGIPEQEIAIRTGDRNELKNVDLLSPDCPIRYIITVNALKEGWDCPFAYVLATVANRTSVVDVEQILGRILCLYKAQRNPSDVLNMSYVITSSADFHQTLIQVVKGLEGAGFTKDDYRAPELPDEPEAPQPGPHGDQGSISPSHESAVHGQPDKPSVSDEPNLPIGLPLAETEEESDIPDVDGGTLRDRVEASKKEAQNAVQSGTLNQDPLLGPAISQNAKMEAEIAKAGKGRTIPNDLRERGNHFSMIEKFREDASALQIPQFMLDRHLSQPQKPGSFSLFTDPYPLLSKEPLEAGFSLKDKDAHVDFSTIRAEMARVDVDEDKTLRAWLMSKRESEYYQDWFNAYPSENRLLTCKKKIMDQLTKRDSVNQEELGEYIDRVLSTMSEDQISEMEQSWPPYSRKIKEKVEFLLSKHRSEVFNRWRLQGKIVCRPSYSFPDEISPIKYTSIIPKSLYSAEEDVNKYERQVIWALSDLPNVKWWHRNISSKGFEINGPVSAYPDFIVMLESGRILMVETKGDFLEWESREKARIGDLWAQMAGDGYQYYMVFESVQPEHPGMYSQEHFLETVKGL